MRWDIHDEMVDENGNAVAAPIGSGVGGRSDPTHDNVKQRSVPVWWPVHTYGDASFTRLLANDVPVLFDVPSDFPTAGPFDPNYAEQTLLPDGHLDAGDAPMPAARIDFAIAANTNPLTSTDGVGSLVDLNKSKVYSQDDKGDNGKFGNLFAPYYSQWIPATARDPFGYASGVDGALITNNFPGFLDYGRVTNWSTFPLVTPTSLKTKCRQIGTTYRMTPGEPQTVAVYTDEHGEARVGYLPGGSTGNDFYFDALNVTPNDSNLGCDLKSPSDKVLGTSHISAIARYPYQKVTDPDKPAKTTLVKTVYNLFDKHLSYYPKNSNYSSDNAELDKIIVAHAQDIQGTAFVGETVCFTGAYDSTGAAISGLIPPANPVVITKPDGTVLSIANVGEIPSPVGAGFKCTKTDVERQRGVRAPGQPRADR